MSEDKSVRRSSGRATKRKHFIDEDVSYDKKVRSCIKAGCYASEPTCCLLACDSCSVSGYTSRWYHMSLSEHFCNNCFDYYYRAGKTGNIKFSKWTNDWGLVARASKPTIKRFVANELLPYWVKCTQKHCGKWRVVSKPGILDPKFIKNFKCPVQPNIKSASEVLEDKDVSLVLDPNFMIQLHEEPLLKHSPAGTYLKRFLPEDIGMCAIDCATDSFAALENIEPFVMEQCGESPIWVKPDEMDKDEVEFANRVVISPATYLGLRNFLVALWNLTPAEWLSFNKINEYLICRGLIRIYLLSVADQILDILTKKSIINYGIIQNPSLEQFKTSAERKILVIGAGVSGLAAASHLQNLGFNVTVFEAEPDLGGCVRDVPILGAGAYFIHGLKNNPFTTLAIQAKAELQSLEKDTLIFTQNGDIVPDSDSKRAQYELNGLLYGAVETASVTKRDSSCYETLVNNCNEMRAVTPVCSDFNLFHHLLSQCEIEIRSDLRNVSLLNWEYSLPVIGGTAFMPNGLRLLLLKLARTVDIKYNEKVAAIDSSGAGVKVTTPNGEKTFSKVLITVPLSVLQTDCIKFVPELPDYKKKAFNSLCSYYCEKLILEFPRKFWSKSIAGPFSKFGIVSSERIFEVFCDITEEKENSTPTLVAFIPWKSMELMKELNAKEIVDKCMSLLKTTFRHNVPRPSKWGLTNWKNELHGGAFGTYLKVGSDKSAYDDLAKSIDNKLYFAGEATFKNVPSSITGAYLSGLREAANIIKNF